MSAHPSASPNRAPAPDRAYRPRFTRDRPVLDADAFEWRDLHEPDLPDNPFVVDATAEDFDVATAAAAEPRDTAGDAADRWDDWAVPADSPRAAGLPEPEAAGEPEGESRTAPVPLAQGTIDDEPPFRIDPATGRRTVTITGRPEVVGRRTMIPPSPAQAARRAAHGDGRAPAAGPRRVSGAGRKRPSGTATRVAQRPDRVAFWAVLMALFLVLAAATTSRAAVPDAPAGTPPMHAAPAAR